MNCNPKLFELLYTLVSDLNKVKFEAMITSSNNDKKDYFIQIFKTSSPFPPHSKKQTKKIEEKLGSCLIFLRSRTELLSCNYIPAKSIVKTLNLT